LNSGDIQAKDFKVAIRERGELLLFIVVEDRHFFSQLLPEGLLGIFVSCIQADRTI
jgi:hypothetical protein